MKYLLDTAPWINAVTLPHTVPERVRRLLAAEEVTGLCSISLLEAAILHRIGRLELGGTLEQFFAAGFSSNLRLVELSVAIAARTNNLSKDFHGDPFDRTIVATAATLDLTLITTDSAIRDAKQCSVEFYSFKPSRTVH